MKSRRQILTGGLGLVGGMLLPERAATATKQSTLPHWSPGEFDIHHINTGRGNACFVIGPDGTTMLIDCGASNTSLRTSAPPRPDASRAPGEWVARYALRHARAARRTSLDYIVASHVHADHIGDVPLGRTTVSGSFIRTGVSEVDQFMPADLVIDRAYPSYGGLPLIDAPFADNYLAWLDNRRRAGRRVEAARVGSLDQIRLRSRKSFPSFSVRVIAGNGRVWTGHAEASRNLFPDAGADGSSIRPPENACSIALRIAYGRFSYYTGGDLNADTQDGRQLWADVETPVVRATGRVEVALANHHGYFDACGPEFTKQLDAQAYIIPSWHVGHPGPAQIERLLGAWPGEKPRDVFALDLLPANRLINERFVPKLKSSEGHVVVRVAASGNEYSIFVLDSSGESDVVKSAHGPYVCRL